MNWLMERVIKQGNEKAFEHFKSQYGKNNFDLLRVKLLRNENQKLREVNEEISAKLYILNERISTLE